MGGAYKLEGAIGEVSSPIQDPHWRKPPAYCPSVRGETPRQGSGEIGKTPQFPISQSPYEHSSLWERRPREVSSANDRYQCKYVSPEVFSEACTAGLGR